MIDTTPLFRSLARRRLGQLSAMNPPITQEKQLRHLIARAKNTQFGRDHHFSEIKTVADYQKRVPLRTYEDFWADYWQHGYPNKPDMTWPGATRHWALSSGTSSGTTKYIPCPSAMVASNKKAALDILCFQLGQNKDFRPTDGKTFILGGSTDLKEEKPGFFSGDLSGIAAKTVPFWAKPFTFPPTEMSLIKNWEEKLETLARRSLSEKIRVLSGTPIWLLLLFRRIRALLDEDGRRHEPTFPHLQLLIHGGTSYEPYRQATAPFLEQLGAQTREVYPASEGFLAIADRGVGEGLRLNLDIGLFFEFVPLEELGTPSPTRHWVGNIEAGINYAVAITSCAGVYGYLLGDIVRFVDTKPPRLLIAGRTAFTLSEFGEHLDGEEIEDAVMAAARQVDLSVIEYSVGTVFGHHDHDTGCHVYILETAQPVLADAKTTWEKNISAALDAHLIARNEDYESHRKNGLTLKPPQVVLVPPQTFANWMRSRGKLGGQNKVPRVIADSDLFASLMEFANDATIDRSQ